MRPGAGGVHLGGGNCPVFGAHVHNIFNLCEAGDSVFLHAIYINTQQLILSYFESPRYPILDGDSQILNLFVINLQHRSIDLVIYSRLLSLHPLEDFVAGYGNDALVWSVSDHAVGFSRSCLTIRKKTAVIALPCIVQNLLPNFLKYLGLIRILGAWSFEETVRLSLETIEGPEREIKGEFAFALPLERLKDSGRILHVNNALATKLLFSGVEWPDPHCNLDAHIKYKESILFGYIFINTNHRVCASYLPSLHCSISTTELVLLRLTNGYRSRCRQSILISNTYSPISNIISFIS